MAAANGYDKTAAREDRSPSICGNDLGSLSRHRISIEKYFNLHGNSQPKTAFTKPMIENRGSMIAIF
jgi:hypothetical protein